MFSRDAPKGIPEHRKSQSVCRSVCCWKCVCTLCWRVTHCFSSIVECEVTACFWREMTSSVPLAELAEWSVLAASAWCHWTWKALLKFQLVFKHALLLAISPSHLWIEVGVFQQNVWAVRETAFGQFEGLISFVSYVSMMVVNSECLRKDWSMEQEPDRNSPVLFLS